MIPASGERRAHKRKIIRVSNGSFFGPWNRDQYIAWIDHQLSLVPLQYRQYARFNFSGYSDDKMNSWANYSLTYSKAMTYEEIHDEEKARREDAVREASILELRAAQLRRQSSS